MGLLPSAFSRGVVAVYRLVPILNCFFFTREFWIAQDQGVFLGDYSGHGWNGGWVACDADLDENALDLGLN